MPQSKKDPIMEALEAVHAALKPLDAGGRSRVLASVRALIDVGEPSEVGKGNVQVPKSIESEKQVSRIPSRRVGLVELIREKKPRSNSQLITLFAYFRERYESSSTFGRDDLKPYFPLGKQPPPSNYPRDFTEAVKRGWIHEDRDNSYITSKGLEVVEGAFSNIKAPGSPRRASKRRRSKT